MSLKPQAQFKFTKDSLRLRLTLFFVAALALLLLILSVALTYRFDDNIQVEFDTSLYNYVSGLSENLNWNYFGDINIKRKALVATERILPFQFKEIYFQMVDQTGRGLARLGPDPNFSLIIDKNDLSTLLTTKALLRDIRISGRSYRMISFPIIRDGGVFKVILQVAVPMDNVLMQKRKHRNFLYTIIPIALLVVFISGYFFSSFVLSPLNNIISQTRRMTASDLKTRLATTSGEDELNVLALSLNELFDRLDKAFSSQEDFIANASHQLKTPLAILKGELDVFRKQKRTVEEINEFSSRFSDELDHLIKIVRDLLVLAGLDAGKNTLQRQQLLLDELVFESVARFNSLAEKKNINIQLDFVSTVSNEEPSDLKFQGDSNLIKTMIQALLENAIQHSPKGGCIAVGFGAKDANVFFKITNKGEVIKASEFDKIFERFYQSSSSSSGIGLGLAISKKIAQAHGGDITVTSDSTHGTTFIVDIKKI